MISIIKNTDNYNTNFKSSVKKTEKGNDYYHSNVGAITGTVLAVPAFLDNTRKIPQTDMDTKLKQAQAELEYSKNVLNVSDEEINKIRENMKKSFGIDPYDTAEMEKLNNEMANALKKSKSAKYIKGAAAAVLSVACGLIIDKLRNQKAQKASDEIQEKGVNKASMDNDNIRSNGHYPPKPYYHSNEGKKWGGPLGVACGAVMSALALFNTKDLPISKKALTSKFGIGLQAGVALVMGIGGLIIGAITDSITNSKAKKNA